jgi:hypothetical protein
VHSVKGATTRLAAQARFPFASFSGSCDNRELWRFADDQGKDEHGSRAASDLRAPLCQLGFCTGISMASQFNVPNKDHDAARSFVDEHERTVRPLECAVVSGRVKTGHA